MNTVATNMFFRLALIIVAITVAGCSSSKSKPASIKKPAATTSTSSTTVAATSTTTAVPTLTIQQVASIVAGSRPGIIEMADNVHAECTTTCDELGFINGQTFGLRAIDLQTQLQAATLIGHQAPAELVGLVKSTDDEMLRVYNASLALKQCGASCSGQVVIDMFDLAESAKAQLAAWDPYM